MTLHDLTRGLVLIAVCECGHNADFDVQGLGAAKGSQLDTIRVTRCLRCSRCASRQVQIRSVFDRGVRFKHKGMAGNGEPVCAVRTIGRETR